MRRKSVYISKLDSKLKKRRLRVKQAIALARNGLAVSKRRRHKHDMKVYTQPRFPHYCISCDLP